MVAPPRGLCASRPHGRRAMALSGGMASPRGTSSSTGRTGNEAGGGNRTRIISLEGCKLSAYPDPETWAEPWTIGWGSTAYGDGAPVNQGDRISQELADALLAGRLEQDCRLLAQQIPLWQQLSANQQGGAHPR